MSKKSIWYLAIGICLVIGIWSLGFVIYGCGQQGDGGGGETATNYIIQGSVLGVQTAALKASAATTVTHIVAIGANNEKYLATLNSDGTFSIGISKGWPYVLGFYNKSAGQITLLGYLRQTNVDWDSLPILEPTGDITDLGSVEVDSASVEAIPSIALNDLISQMNMSQSTAQYYGQIDDNLAVLTNLDMDSNGEFDFDEGKHYLFQTYIAMGPGVEPVAGQITKMLSGYNDDYFPQPYDYGMVLAATGDTKTDGTSATLSSPQPMTNYNGVSSSTQTGTISADSFGWSVFFRLNDALITSPAAAPPGTYVATVGAATYTIQNFKASEIVKVNSNNGIIYPVFHLVTNESGYITTVNYKWQKLVNGAIEVADAAEVKAAIEDTSLNTTFVHPSPFISFFRAAIDPSATPIKFDRDGSSLDISGNNIKLSEIHHIQASYNLTSRVVCKFDLK